MRGAGPAVAALAAPERLAAEIGRQLWDHLPGLLGANLLFLAWCAPAALLALLGLPRAALAVAPFAVGAGLAGLMAYAGGVARGDAGRVWRDSLRGTRAGFAAVAGHAATVVLAGWAHALALETVVAREAAWESVVLWAGQLGVLALLSLVEAHAASLIGLYGQGPFAAARNALILSARRPDAALALLAVAAAGWTLTWTLGGAPLIILPAVLAVCAVNVTLRQVDTPWEGSR
jgi:hypothetical protein